MADEDDVKLEESLREAAAMQVNNLFDRQAFAELWRDLKAALERWEKDEPDAKKCFKYRFGIAVQIKQLGLGNWSVKAESRWSNKREIHQLPTVVKILEPFIPGLEPEGQKDAAAGGAEDAEKKEASQLEILPPPDSEGEPPVTTQIPAIPADDLDAAVAWDLITETRRASVATIKRRMKITNEEAIKIMDRLQQYGMVGPAQGGNAPREILVEPATAN